MQKWLMKALPIALVIGLIAGVLGTVHADAGNDNSDAIDEKRGMPIVVYGDALSEAQKKDTSDLLEVTDTEQVEEVTVDGEDLARYIDGNPNANMYSSAKITWESEGEGITVNIVTPDNITEVSTEMYANALLTAGAEDVTVDVASSVKVTGHSALTGIYKAYDVEGDTFDKERMELANEELDVATELADEDGLSQEEVSELLTDIKQEIAEKDPATREDVEEIVQEKLDELEISLSDEDRQLLMDLFAKMRDLDIDFGKVKTQLEDIADKVQEKMDELGLDEGFWNKVGNFLKRFFEAIANFFKNLVDG